MTGTPTGPFLVSENTVDSPSTEGNCVYAAAPIGGVPIPTTVFSGGAVIKIIPPQHLPSPVSATKLNILNPVPCNPIRAMKPGTNTTVYINGQLPCIASAPPLGGDTTTVGTGTPRTLTGPFQCPTIIVGANT